MVHALIVGTHGVGKSTLIRRVLEEWNRPLFGFETKKEVTLFDERLGDPVYIYDAGKKHCQTEENLVGYCKNRHATTIVSAFDRAAQRLMRPVPADHVIKMDEIGFMEAKSEAFCQAVLSRLDGEIPVLAAVKDKEIPFLQAVRVHPNARCFYITEENREALFYEVLAFVKAHWENSY